ncbi:aspartate transaminase [Pseudomonas aeruginosa]|nr:aspartate transaminase [Pseudomonas aeruginosa]
MRYSDFTQRIAGDGAAAWDIHYRALARVEQGEEILLLSVGDPDFDTPAPIVQAAIDSLLAGNTHYADVRGKRALRQRIAERHRRRSGQAVDAEQVVVLAGAQCALYAVVQCLLNPGDEVIVAEPMYVTYEAVFGACGARGGAGAGALREWLPRAGRGGRRTDHPAHARDGAEQPAQPVRRQPAAGHLGSPGRAVHGP